MIYVAVWAMDATNQWKNAKLQLFYPPTQQKVHQLHPQMASSLCIAHIAHISKILKMSAFVTIITKMDENG